jgi:hypothetical protein
MPDNLLSRHMLKEEFATAANNRFEALHVEHDESQTTVDELNEQVEGGLRRAWNEARAAHQEPSEMVEPPAQRKLAALRAEVDQCEHDLRACIKVQAERKSNAAAPQVAGTKGRERKERKAANSALKTATEKLERHRRLLHGNSMAMRRRNMPLKFWRDLKALGHDPGAPTAPARAVITDRQTDAKGKLVTTNKKRCLQRMREDRQEVYSNKRVRSSACNESIDDAVAAMHIINSTEVAKEGNELDAASAAARSAADAWSLAADECDERRDLTTALATARAQLQSDEHPCNRVVSQYKEEVEHSRRPLTRDEVIKACATMGDVGPGTDGLPPAMMQRIGDGATVEAVHALFQRCWRTGTLPTSWQEHRTIFLFKKGDPFHLGNYRGISIDQLLLKLWTLVVQARAEELLETTRGLSFMQGGFRRQRGPPESIFTLTEAVRAATLQGRKVEIVFVDVKMAYDSVLHPLLFYRCAMKGIGGPLLSAVQALYSGAVSRVDANGELLPAVRLLRGVLQGNSLSPLLFNVYLEFVISELCRIEGRRFVGLWLPASTAAADASRATQNDYLPCLFFADDGALLESDHDTLQRMVDRLTECLDASGLEINVKKTKWMVVPPACTNEDGYKRLKDEALKAPINVAGAAVELVDEFDYLGARIWWRWNWQKAWALATHRARKCYFGALRGGWFRRAGSMATQLEYARAKIFCHFNYVAALAGTGGCKSSAPWKQCTDIVTWTLRTIAGVPRGNETALRIEAGVWAEGAQFDMLLLRMRSKFDTMPLDSSYVRAMCLSRATTHAAALTEPDECHSNVNNLHRRTWWQELVAASRRFVVDIDDPELVTAQVWRNDQWRVIPQLGAGAVVQQQERVRLICTPRDGEAAPTGDLVVNVTCWHLPDGTCRSMAVGTWTQQLKDATYAALRARGNAHRNIHVQSFLLDQVRNSTRLKAWAGTISGSHMQPYWHLGDAHTAQWLLRVRFDSCPNEDCFRFAPHGPGLPRIADYRLRACYLCSCIHALAPHVFWPESLEHVLLKCDHDRIRARRTELRNKLRALATEHNVVKLTRGIDAPDFDDDTALLTTMQLCTGVGYTAVTQRHAIVPTRSFRHGGTNAVAVAQSMRAAPQHTRNVAVAAATIAWMRPLIDDWQDALREPRRGVPPHQTPGYRLAQTVARFAKCVFAERRVALSAAPLADEFQLRARDPCAGNNRSQQSQQPQQRRQQHGVRPAHATVLSPSTHAPLAPQPPPCGAPPGVAVIGGANRSYRSRVISLVTAAPSGSSRDDHIESRDTTPQPRRLLSIATRSSGNQTGDEPG